MAISKVVYHTSSSDTTGTTWMDVTPDTVTASKLLANETATDASGTQVIGNIATKTSSDLTASGKTVTVPAGYYATQATKNIEQKYGSSLNATTIYENGNFKSRAEVLTDGYYAAGTAIAQASTSISGMPTQAATTITPTTSSQTAVAANKWTTGAVTVDGVTTSNLTAGNIKSGVTVKVGTATDDDSVASVTGTYTGSDPVLQAKTVTPSSDEQIVVADGYTGTVPLYTSAVMSYAAGASQTGTITFSSGSLTADQTYRVIGRVDIINASNAVVEYYDIDSAIVWNTTAQYVLQNDSSKYVGSLSLYKGNAYNKLSWTLVRNLAGSWGWRLQLHFYASNATYGGLSQVTVNPIPSQYIVPSGTISITENGTVDVTNYASASVSVSGGATTLKMGVLRPDAELVDSWTYDKWIVGDEGITLPAYTTTATTLKAQETLDTITIDESSYSYYGLYRGYVYPNYNISTVGTGRYEFFFVSQLCEFFNVPFSAWNVPEDPSPSAITVFSQTGNQYYSVYRDSWKNVLISNQMYGVYLSTGVFTYTPGGPTITVKSPVLMYRGSTAMYSQTYWDATTDVRYQYILELYRSPKGNLNIDGFNAATQLNRIISAESSQSRKLT